MADLLQSLLTPWPAHTHPQHRTEANMFGSSSSTHQPNPIPAPASGLQDVSDSDHIFVDADEYLQGIPTSTPGPTTSRDEPSKVMPAIQPVQIGQSRSSKHSVVFHLLAQEKRIAATFEFKEPTPQQFSVTLTLDDRRVVEEPGPWPSKKAAKEAVCEKGYQVLTGMEGIATPTPTNIENWVGMLQQYYDGRDHACPRPTYTDFAVGNLFACELVIDKRVSAPFGGRYTKFPSKRAAKTNAAREAVEWLTANNFMGPQGPPTKKKRKGGSISQVAPESGMIVEIKRTANFAQKVCELCPMIGLPPPEYRLLPDTNFESMYSGAAFFKDPIIPYEPIGEVRNVYGKKKAKEEIAKGVLAFLKEWTERQGIELKERE
ncbi:MAG: hypothetical protein M1839_008837 [Geoglossum umbratile]|nr:MAG: hypothetical protein M1839_008837 [Geoglossum umbratile]